MQPTKSVNALLSKSRNIFFIFLTVLAAGLAQGKDLESSVIFDCTAMSGATKAHILVDSAFKTSKLILQTKDTDITCPLQMAFAENLDQAVVPLLNYEFHSKCPTLPQGLQEDIAPSTDLKIYLKGKDRATSTLRWLNSMQPTDCKINSSDYFTLRLNTTNWKSR